MTHRFSMGITFPTDIKPGTGHYILGRSDMYEKKITYLGFTIKEIKSDPHQILSSMVNPLTNKLWCLRVCSTSLLKTLWEKEKLLVPSNFSFSHSVFYTFEELSSIFIKFEIVVCKLLQFGRV